MIAYIKPTKIKIYINSARKTMAQVKAETGCTHIINGGYFNMSTFEAVCVLIADGKTYAYEWNGRGYCFDTMPPVLRWSTREDKNFIYGVRLVENGQAVVPLDYNAAWGGAKRKTAMGVMPDGRIWLYCSDDLTTPEQLQQIALASGVDSAIMLDGGGSTQGDFNGQTVTSDRIVHNFICFWAEEDSKSGDDIEIRQSFLTNNDCYKEGKTITPKGIMVHSTGANNPSLSRFLPGDELIGYNKYNNHWNQPGLSVCVHALIGKDKNGNVRIYQTLPWNMRGWHAGGSANDTHIGFEICEDGLTDPVYFNAVYNAAVNLCVHLCKTQGISPDNIVCHSEGYKLGIASNHADVMHWFPKHGKTMDDFRKAVKDKLSTSAPTALTQEQFNEMFDIAMKEWLSKNSFRLEVIK